MSTCVRTPSAPSPTRPSRQMSSFCVGEHSRNSPSAVTSENPATCPASPVNAEPVPCVEVEIEPAIVWAVMSPMLARANPAAASRWLTSCNTMPAGMRATIRVLSIPIPSPKSLGRSKMSLLGTIAVKLWPLPAMRMRWLSFAPATIPCNSSTLRGACMLRGRARTVPAQLRQRVIRRRGSCRRRIRVPAARSARAEHSRNRGRTPASRTWRRTPRCSRSTASL